MYGVPTTRKSQKALAQVMPLQYADCSVESGIGYSLQLWNVKPYNTFSSSVWYFTTANLV